MENINLVALKGSEKQVAWAEKIRKDFIQKIETAVDSFYYNGRIAWAENNNELRDGYITAIFRTKAAIAWVMQNQDSATWYIDNRVQHDNTLLANTMIQLWVDAEGMEALEEIQITNIFDLAREELKKNTVLINN